MKVPIEIVNAFIDGDAGGNPAGVVLDANSLNYDQKLKIAQKADTGNAFTPNAIGSERTADGTIRYDLRHYFTANDGSYVNTQDKSVHTPAEGDLHLTQTEYTVVRGRQS